MSRKATPVNSSSFSAGSSFAAPSPSSGASDPVDATDRRGATDPVDATDRRPPSGERALVLGGGGSTGNAWLIGIAAGLLDAGLDVTDADLIVGTSAGATAAAQLTGADIGELYAASLVPPPSRPIPARASDRPERAGAPGGGSRQVSSSGAASARSGSTDGHPSNRPVIDHLERMHRLIAASTDAADLRRRLSDAALERRASMDPSTGQRWRATVVSRLPSPAWPDRAVLLTAVDARTATPVVFDRESGVDLADAVAASCSSGFAYRIGERDFIDGGYRRNENADLASGFARVLVLAPFGGESFTPEGWGLNLATQIDELRAGGSRVQVVGPEADAAHLFGANAMDGSMRPRAAQVGFEQGRRLADELSNFWR
ncbi:patatin-like phospholipase family protein [Microbacterium sp. 179-I 3D3 NHS]|uniref:patatin-like phospholipase family protein n=1 Tax=Microbacterium sp. 179-I 3D3 NHS TaxID=3142382 RepID=UPI0039A1BAE8